MGLSGIEQRALVAARATASREGLVFEHAEVVHAGSNVIIRFTPVSVIARVMTGTVALHANPRIWLEREIAVLQHLEQFHVAVRPSPLVPPGPFEQDGLWMTLLEWVEHERHATVLTGAERLGRALRDLHSRLAGFSGDLQDLRETQADIERLLGQLRPRAGLEPADIQQLHRRLQALTSSVFEASLPRQPLHGDASLTNLLSTKHGLIWNDFEDVGRGPVHWDLAGFLLDLRQRGADPDYLKRFLEAYGELGEDDLEPFTSAQALYWQIWQLYDAQRAR